MRSADEVGVLALPAEPGRRRQRLFHHRRGVHEDLHVLACARGEPRGDLLETALDQVVVVAVARIDGDCRPVALFRSEEHTSELQSLMRISYAVFCLKKKKINTTTRHNHRNYINIK